MCNTNVQSLGLAQDEFTSLNSGGDFLPARRESLLQVLAAGSVSRVAVFGKCATGEAFRRLLGERCLLLMDSDTLAGPELGIECIVIATRSEYNDYVVDLLRSAGFGCPLYVAFGPVRTQWEHYTPLEPAHLCLHSHMSIQTADKALEANPALGAAHSVEFGGTPYAYYSFHKLLIQGDRTPMICLPTCGQSLIVLHESEDVAGEQFCLEAFRRASRSIARRQTSHLAVLGNGNARYFGHAVHDLMPKLLLLEHAGYTGRYLLALRSPWLVSLVNAAGVGTERLEFYSAPLVLNEALVFQRFNSGHLRRNPALVRELRERMLRHFGIAERTRTRRLYLTRRAAAHRRVLNEDEFVAMLERHGYETVAFEKLPLREQVELVMSARSLVAPHGSGSVLALFLEPGAAFVQMHNPAYVNDSLRAILADCLGITYISHVTGTDPSPEMPCTTNRHLLVDVASMERLIRELP